MPLQNIDPFQIAKLKEIQQHISQDMFQEQRCLTTVRRINDDKLKQLKGIQIAALMHRLPQFADEESIDLKCLLFCIADAILNTNYKRYDEAFEEFAKKFDVDKLYNAWKLAISAKPPVTQPVTQPDNL